MRRLLLLLCALSTLARPAAAEERHVDGIAAQVGGDIVLISEVNSMVAKHEQRMREAGASEQEIAKLRADGLETMIEWRLLEKIVRNAELFATDAEIDRTIAMIAEENGLSVEQLQQSVATQDMSFADYRQQIKRELERRKVINSMISNRVTVDEADIRKLYDERFGNQPAEGSQVNLRQILVIAGDEVKRSTPEACAIALDLRKRIDAGEEFESLAQQYSAAAPQHGGDIGWLHEQSLAGWMNEAIAPLEAGQVTPVIELPIGCTLLKLVERKAYEQITFEKARDALGQEVFEMKMAEEYRKWLEELRGDTYIERRGYFADAAKFARPAGEAEGEEGATGTIFGGSALVGPGSEFSEGGSEEPIEPQLESEAPEAPSEP